MASSTSTPYPDLSWADPAVMLAADQLQRVDKLRCDLAACDSVAEKAMVCQRTRDDLLSDHRSLEVLVSVCRDVMKDSEQLFTSASEPDPCWREFANLAEKGARMRALCDKALQDVADRWGSKVVHHYGWGSMGVKYCQDLRALARKLDWPTFVRMVNPVLLDRYKFTSLRQVQFPARVNSMAGPYLEEVRSQVQGAKLRLPNQRHDADYSAAKIESEARYRAVHILPADLGLDRFGVLVLEKFDHRPETLDDSLVALSSSVQHQSRANPAPLAAVGLASIRPSIGPTALPPTEGASPFPARLPANIMTAGGNGLPFPPSPPTSPDAQTISMPSPAESEQQLSSNRKRVAPAHSGRAAKRHETRVLWRVAEADARRIYGKPSPPSLQKSCN